jgi:hypothetical protein
VSAQRCIASFLEIFLLEALEHPFRCVSGRDIRHRRGADESACDRVHVHDQHEHVRGPRLLPCSTDAWLVFFKI